MEWKGSGTINIPDIKYSGRPVKWQPVVLAFSESEDKQWWNEFPDSRELYRASSGLGMAVRALGLKDKMSVAIRAEDPHGAPGRYIYLVKVENGKSK